MDALIFKKMRAIVGGRVRFLLSGGAPLSPDTPDYVRCALSVPLVQGYGLTESCACGTIMDKDENSTGGAGPPLQGVLIKLINWEEGNYRVSDDPPRGEIVIGGGDIGEMAHDGILKVVDRKKDLVKLNYGEYVSLG